MIKQITHDAYDKNSKDSSKIAPKVAEKVDLIKVSDVENLNAQDSVLFDKPPIKRAESEPSVVLLNKLSDSQKSSEKEQLSLTKPWLTDFVIQDDEIASEDENPEEFMDINYNKIFDIFKWHRLEKLMFTMFEF